MDTNRMIALLVDEVCKLKNQVRELQEQVTNQKSDELYVELEKKLAANQVNEVVNKKMVELFDSLTLPEDQKKRNRKISARGRKNISQGVKKYFIQNPDLKQKLSEQQKARWADPVYRANQLAALKKAQDARVAARKLLKIKAKK